MGFWDRLFGRKASAEVPVPSTPAAPANEVPRVAPREYFLHQAGTLLREDPAVEKVERHPEAYGLNVTRAGQQGSVFLENLFVETRELPPGERARVLKRLLVQLWQEGRPGPVHLGGGALPPAAGAAHGHLRDAPGRPVRAGPGAGGAGPAGGDDVRPAPAPGPGWTSRTMMSPEES